MSKIDATYNSLLSLRDDIDRLQNTSPAFYFFQRARCEKFAAQNSMHLKILKSRLDGYVTKYVQHDENQQPITEMRDGVKVYVFPSDAERKNYLDAVNAFLSLKISMEL